MQCMPENMYLLQQQIEMAEHSDDILSVLRTITPFFAQHTASQEMYHLLVAAFTALQVLTSGNEHEGEHCIRAFLLDHLAQDSQGTAAQKNATRLLRECLQEWIAQYADAHVTNIIKWPH